jgi:hypothetical protein
MDKRKGQRVIAGLVLIGLGLALYGFELYRGLGRTTVIFIAAAAFLGAYLVSRTLGFLVPACLLLGVGAGELLERLTDLHTAQTLWLGIGFLGTSAFAWMYEGRRTIWPLVPGTLLALFSVPQAGRFVDLAQRHWPLVLVAVGLAVLLGSFGGGRRTGASAAG